MVFQQNVLLARTLSDKSDLTDIMDAVEDRLCREITGFKALVRSLPGIIKNRKSLFYRLILRTIFSLK